MVGKQIAIGFTVLLLLVAGTALLPVGYPQEEDEDVHEGLEIAGPYGVQKVPEITSAIALPKYSGQAMVYRTVNSTITKDDALKMAEKFGMTGSLEEDTLSYYTNDDPYTFDIEKEGGYMTYTWADRHSGVDPRDRPENLPTDEECRKIAESFLTSHGLMPEGAVFSSISHGEGFFLNSTDDTSVQTYKDTRVLFTGTLSGYPTAGSGIYVTVGGGGDVLKVGKRWRDAEPYKEFPILSPEEAIEELKQTGVVTTVGSPKKAVVDEAKLCYYASPPRDEQPYLKPAYYVHGTVEGEDETGTFFQYIPAVPELGKGLY
ncbi:MULTISPECIES: hypothetical protein [unclassified Methanoculleus]|jgi:hypothetical protein|uniref:hypothetical protein n=1 Tax=unclassified Methanoculleus TaxID=2619537 RepID=UPI0025F75A42|nr:hypothetical protein [Methanoculleus sp. UBA377]MDD2472568.1 hypothetical protein [Methanoculleus sp.]